MPCYNTSGGFLSCPIEEVLDSVEAGRSPSGIGGIKIKVGHPDARVDMARLEAVADRIGGRVALMVDANQQWDRAAALRMCRNMEGFGLTWIEEPLDAYDVEGHAALAAAIDTPIASGEMLVSAAEHFAMIREHAVDFIQPDAARVGGITQFQRVTAMAQEAQLAMAPHFAMELHVHLSAAYPHTAWVEHFDWLDPLFNERQEIEGGRMVLSGRPGLGVTLSEQARAWTTRVVPDRRSRKPPTSRIDRRPSMPAQHCPIAPWNWTVDSGSPRDQSQAAKGAANFPGRGLS